MKATWVLLVALNLLRFGFAFSFDLVPQEAYYLLYAKNLALSYFDHPPVLAWVLRLFIELFGEREWVLRFAMFSMSIATQAIWISLAKKILADRWTDAALVFLSTLLFAVTSLISTPDVPLLLFWTLSVQQLHSAIFEGRARGWVIAGIAMGLAFDSKYTGLGLQAGLVLFLLLSTEHRKLWRTPWPYLSLVLAQITMAPVYVWNAQHGYASFLFQTKDRAAHASGVGILNLLKLVTTQSVLLAPPLFIAMVLALRQARRNLFLACFFVPAFVGFVLISVGALVKPNWLMPAYVTGSLLAAGLLSARWRKVNVALSLAFHVLVAVELIAYPVPIRSDDTWKGWRALGEQVDRLVSEHPVAFAFSTDGYKTSAELRFYSRTPTYGANVVGLPGLQFDYLDTNFAQLQGKDALFLDSDTVDVTPSQRGAVPAEVQARFASVQELPPLVIEERGRPLRKFYAYLCRGYRPP